MKRGFVYIIQSQSSGRYYVGVTKDVRNRIKEHNNGESLATRNRGPWIIKFTKEYATIREAKQIEYKLKRLKRRDYIENMIKEGCINLGL